MIYIITGHYGSGKTEFAINFAMGLKNPTIVDLDIVNPYFRTKDAEEILENNNIKLISTQFANTNIDMPTVPPEIYGALLSDYDVVIDVGGDDDGAVALGQYYNYFKNKPYEMIFVVNTKRPLTSTCEDIINMIRNIELTSRLKVTAIVNNTNVKNETKVNDVLGSLKIIDEVSKETKLPIMAISATKEIAEELNLDIKVIPLKLYLILPWEV